MRVRLLGPVDVCAGDVCRPVSGLRRQAVMATLALHRGEVVSIDRLPDVLWGDEPPATARNTLQRHISHLREVLGDQTYDELAKKGAQMTTAAVVAYAYDQIDQARTELEHHS